MKERKVRKIERKYNIRRNQSLTEVKEIIKQQMQAKAQRIRRFDKRCKFYWQNKTFKRTLRDSSVNLEKSQWRSMKHQKCRKLKIFGVKYGISKPIIAMPHGLKIKKKRRNIKNNYLKPKKQKTRRTFVQLLACQQCIKF